MVEHHSSRQRGTAHQWSKSGAINDSAVNQVYFTLRDAVRVESENRPALDGPTSILPRKKTVTAGGPLPTLTTQDRL
jgi:hypothetical protein